jgi:endonuclease YncB( thermonuclease family)
MGRLVAHRGIGVAFVAIALVATACSSARPTPDAFAPSTTTTTVPGGETVVTTTPLTLPPLEEQEIATVISVTDGDTFKVRIDGVEFDVRMLGINAPESDECWGPESTVLLAGLIDGRDILLVSGEEDTDQFGRLLRYIYLDEPQGPVFVNSIAVESGNAIGLSNGHEYERSFKSLEGSAYQSGLGMWGTFVCGDAEGIAADRPVVRVSEVQFNPDGPDNEKLGEETVTIVNEGYGRVSLAGWVLRDESSSNRMTFPRGTLLAPGDTVTVVTGCSGGPADAVYWCNDGAVWSNQGDTVIVSDTMGNAVIRYAYTGDDDGS